jgi:hypothetical protein
MATTVTRAIEMQAESIKKGGQQQLLQGLWSRDMLNKGLEILTYHHRMLVVVHVDGVRLCL